MTKALIDRYMVRCPYCKVTFAIEGASPWLRSHTETLSLVEGHASACPKTEQRVQFLSYGKTERRPEAAYNVLSCTWKVTQVRGVFNALVKCDGRCTHAKGGDCECSCGGRNHGSQL